MIGEKLERRWMARGTDHLRPACEIVKGWVLAEDLLFIINRLRTHIELMMRARGLILCGPPGFESMR